MPDTLKREDEIDARAEDMFQNHSGLQDAEQQTGIQSGSGDSSIDRQGEDLREKARQGEEQGSWNTNLQKGQDSPGAGGSNAFSKGINLVKSKKAASGAMVGLIVGIVSLISAAFTSLPFAVIQNLTNHNDSSSRTNPTRFVAYMKGMFLKGNSLGCSGASVGIRCRLGSMNERHAQRLRDAGFKIEGQQKNGRIKPTSITFPDNPDGTRGKTVKSGSAFQREYTRNPAARAALNRGFVAKVGSFKSSFTEWLKKRGYTRGPTKKPSGKTATERIASLRKSTNVAKLDTSSTFRSKLNSKIRQANAKAIGVSSITGIGCIGYNAARAVVAGVKTQHFLMYMGMFLMIAKVADEARTPEGVQPETMATAMAALTLPALSGPGKGLTALDSQGMKAILHGGEKGRSTVTQRILLGNNRSLIAVDNTLKAMKEELGKDNIRAACRSATDLKYAVGLILTMCAIETGASAAAGTVVPGIGNAAGAALAITKCFAKQAVIALAVSWMISKAVSKAVGWAIDALKDSDLEGVDRGPVFGDGVAVGASLATEGANLSAGTYAATSEDQITAFVNETQGNFDTKEAIAREDAKDTPFNIHNPHSLLGSIFTSPAFVKLQTNDSPRDFLLNSLGIFSYITPSTSALDSATAIQDGDYKKENCTDEGFIEAGVVCNIVGRPYYVMSSKALTMETETAVNYMISHDYIEEDDPDGTPKEDSDYDKWVTYCSDQREEFNGLTSFAVEDDDYEWAAGIKCNPKKNSKVDYFAAFYSLVGVEFASGDDEKPEAEEIGEDNAGGNTTFSGDLAWPMQKSYFDANRADWLGPHGSSTGTDWGVGWGDVGVNSTGDGIASDIGDPPDGTPVYAMLGGEVVSTDLCGSNDGITIKSTVEGKNLFIAYMHGTDKEYNVGDTVEAGKQIMKLGAIGCTVNGGHLHVGIAYDGAYICPQDVFKAMDGGEDVNWDTLKGRANSTCSGRI